MKNDAPSPHAITPDLLMLVDAIARHGSFAKAARELGKVPSAVTYAIRKLEDGLDVLLFDRSGHRATLTPAGQALLDDGRQLLQALDDLACRVKRIASGWEVELRIAVSAVLPWRPIYELIEEFQALGSATTLRFSVEVLSGNWDALGAGRADLVIGAPAASQPAGPYRTQAMGQTQFAFCVAPRHPLAALKRPLRRADVAPYSAVVVADTSRGLPPQTRGILAEQAMLVMPTMQAKIEAQIRGLGCGYLPMTLAAPYVAQGVLVTCDTEEGMPPVEHVVYAWRAEAPDEALKWWLRKLQSPRLCESLLGLGEA